MCMTVKEMNEAMEQIQEWKRIKEEAEDNITTLNSKVMEFLNETEECEAVDNKGKPIRRFIGNIFKATVALQRYAVKDWGNLDDEDKQTNEDALNYPDDLYVMGAYDTSKGKIWIITNRISEKAGENATTVCFPDER